MCSGCHSNRAKFEKVGTMSTAIVPSFPSSKAQQENRLKSRKVSKQGGLKPLSRQTENHGPSKPFNATSLVTPRRVLSDLSNNVTSTPWRSDAKRQVQATVGAPTVNTKRQVTGKTHKVEKHSKSEDFPDIEVVPNTMASSHDSPFVAPSYFKELSYTLQHTTYMPPSLQEPPQPPNLTISVPRRPLPTSHELTILEDDMGITQNELSLLDLPEIPNFDF